MNSILCCGNIRRVRKGFLTLYIRNGILSSDEIIDLFSAPRQTLKESKKSVTYRVNEWTVKESRFQHGVGLLKHTFMRRQYRGAWQAACSFAANGIPTPEPLAYAEYRVAGVIWKNALVVRFLEGFQRSDHYASGLVDAGASAARIEAYFHALAEAITSLSATGAYHSDLTGKNILTEDGSSFQFIDLDAVRLNAPYTLERRLRNHVQLYDTFLEWMPDEVLRDFIGLLAPPEEDFDSWMNRVRDTRRIRRERAEALWRKHGRPEND